MTSSTWSTGLPGDVAELRTHPCDIVTATISESAHAGPAVSVLSTADGTERDRVETAGAVKSVVYHEDPGLLLVTTDADRIHAIDPASGGELWAADAASVVATTEKRIFLSADARVWAYRAADGTAEWETTLPDAIYGSLQQPIENGHLLVTVGEREDEELVALDLDTGVERWYYRPGDAENFAHFGNAGLYVTFTSDDRDDDVARVDTTTGMESWSYTAESLGRRPLYPVGDRLCIEDKSAVVAVDTVSGRECWRSASGSVKDLWIEDGIPFVSTLGDRYEFHALDPDTGRSSWRMETEHPVEKITLDGSGDVYACAYPLVGDSITYRISGTTGWVYWQFTTDGSIHDIEADATPTSIHDIEADATPTLLRSDPLDGPRQTLFGVDAADGDPRWTLSDKSLSLVRSTPNLVAVWGLAGIHLVRREDGTVERTLHADARAATDGALFVADGSTVAAYALTPSPAAFEGTDDESFPTRVYDPDEDTDAAVYANREAADGSACPSCGSDLDAYGEVSFCPDCGSDLSAGAE
jgi:outer membrane protein assembly factor BamB